MSNTRLSRAYRRHEAHLDYIVQRLMKKPGFIMVNPPEYNIDIDGHHYGGKADYTRITKNSAGKKFYHVGEIKGNDSHHLHMKGIGQLSKYRRAFPELDAKTIFTRPGLYKRIRFTRQE